MSRGLPFLNSTQIPNIIFDEWMSKLTPAEFKVLLFICRKTYGWHKESDGISLSQITKMTGLSRRGVIKNLASLEAHSLIVKLCVVSAKGDPDPNIYSINLCPAKSLSGESEKKGGVCTQCTEGMHSVHRDSVLSTPLPAHSVPPPYPFHPIDIIQKKELQNKAPLVSGGTARAKRAAAPPSFFLNFESQKWEGLKESDLTAWKSAYPSVNIETQMAQAAQWALSNGTRGQKKNWRKFLTNWFARQENNTFGKKATPQMAPQDNEQLAHAVKEKYPHLDIEVGYNYIEFCTGNTYAYEQIRFSEDPNVFRQRIEHKIRKMSAPSFKNPRNRPLNALQSTNSLSRLSSIIPTKQIDPRANKGGFRES